MTPGLSPASRKRLERLWYAFMAAVSTCSVSVNTILLNEWKALLSGMVLIYALYQLSAPHDNAREAA